MQGSPENGRDLGRNDPDCDASCHIKSSQSERSGLVDMGRVGGVYRFYLYGCTAQYYAIFTMCLISDVNTEKWTNCFKGRWKRKTILEWNINRTNFSACFSFCHHQTVPAFDLNIFCYVWILNHLIASDLQSLLFSLKNVHPCETEHRKCPLF